MKLRTWFVAATGGAIGYVFGAAAGRAKFEQLKSRGQQLAQHPKVQDSVSKVAETVTHKAETLHPKVGGAVKAAAEQVQSKVQGSSQTPDVTSTPSTVGTGGTVTPGPVLDIDGTVPPSPFDDPNKPSSGPGADV
ncbi:MAG: hypothetical protein ACLGIF_03130 [Actinomycetes bacterium]